MSQKIKALVVDDEEKARKLLYHLLDELQCFSEIRMARSAQKALDELAGFDPDMIFVDIKMPGKDGFSFISELPIKAVRPAIVFVTACDQYAIQAIKNQAMDYILKPVDRKDLKQCVQRYLDSRKVVPEKFARLRINTRNGTVFINPASVLYCKADGNYTIICTGEKQHLCSLNLGKVEEMLSGCGFFRIGRSHLINREYITILDRRESQIVLVNDGETATLKISKNLMKELDNL